MPDEDEVVVVAEEILRYLRGHPSAADSLEGIVRWWVARQRFAVQADLVQRALDLLVASNRLARHVSRAGRPTYSSIHRPSRDED